MKNLLEALNKVMAACGVVRKDGRNDFHKYEYTSEHGLLMALRPAMVEHGLLLLPSLDGEVRIDEHGNTHLVMAYTLAHVSGEVWPEKIRAPGCGNDKNSKGVGDKGTYKALTGANKYLLFKLLQIATGDDAENEGRAEASKFDGKTPPPKKEGANSEAQALGTALKTAVTNSYSLPSLFNVLGDENFVKDADRLKAEMPKGYEYLSKVIADKLAVLMLAGAERQDQADRVRAEVSQELMDLEGSLPDAYRAFDARFKTERAKLLSNVEAA